VDLDAITVDTFEGREGQRFWIEFMDGELDLTLASVTRAPDNYASTGKRHPFSPIFHGTLEHVLPQQVWPLNHDELGATEMFLVPIGPDDGGGAMRYEAVFN
jgi:hypothetical protein